MKFYTVLPKEIRSYFNLELSRYQVCMDLGQWSTGWTHLERAHIIGQKYPFTHTQVHWKMLKFGIRMKSSREILGQIPRLLTGGVKSFVGKVPEGNPGGANVPPLKSFPIDAQLQSILDKVPIKS